MKEGSRKKLCSFLKPLKMAVRTGLKKRQRIETGGKELGIASKTDGAGKEVYNSLI